MKFKLAITCFALSICSTSYAAEKADYLNFFDKYQVLSDNFDISVTQLYSDDAVILGFRKTDDGVEQTLKMDGKKWKELLVDSMEIAQERDDRSEFSDIVVHVEKDRAKITANRFSTVKCFHDNKYYMVIAEKPDGSMEIVEEAMESPAKSLCENSEQNDLALVLKGAVAMINKQLPQMVDDDTKLEKTSSEGNTLIYHYVLVNYPASEIEPAALQQLIEPTVLQQTCSAPNLKPVIDQGGLISYRYSGNDGVLILAVDVDRSRCN